MHLENPVMPNRLASEASPYLLQHANNPVNWYPWSPEAFDEARQRDVPVLLSIGYSACHWCHVMEKESFQNTDTAKAMNEGFVNIKVDREERPDIDSVYMKAVQAMTGHGGWPLTAFLTPEGEPFYGGTYFPPEPHPGTASFRQVLEAIEDAYRERKDDVVRNANDLRELLEQSSEEQSVGPMAKDSSEMIGFDLLNHAFGFLDSRFDSGHGGFGTAPKFPQPVTLEFILRVYARTGERRALEIVTHTLHAMARGGIHDHLAGGFHRYSVDARWLVPHFEKMLYDNALLARLYLNAFQATGDPDLREIAERTLEHLLTDMRSPEGGFYSALDADSEGEEGLYYVWTVSEIRALLDQEEAGLFEHCYGVSEGGNFEGRNVLHLPHGLTSVGELEGLKLEDLHVRLREARRQLLVARSLREPPFRDEKILVSWNAMVVRALAEAGAVLRHEGYRQAAVDCLDFLLTSMKSGNRLLRCYKDGVARVDAFLEDYSALGNALLTTYEVTLDPRWLKEIHWVTDQILDLFWDDEEGLLFDSPFDGEALIIRPRDLMDNAVPSGNSLAVELLLRTSHLFGNERHLEIAERVLKREAGMMARFPSAFGRLLSALDRTMTLPTEIAIIGDREDPRTEALVQASWKSYLPNRTLAGASPDEKLSHSIPLLYKRDAKSGHPTAYVCERYACKAPVIDAEALEDQLSQRAGEVGH